MSRRLAGAARGARMWLRVVRRNPDTVTAAVWHGGVMTMPCPPWCAEHQDPDIEQHPADLLHQSEDTTLTVTTSGGSFEVLGIGMAQAPLATVGSSLPYLTVDLDGYERMTPGEVRALADGLEQHAAVLRRYVDDFEPLRAAAAEAMRRPGFPRHLPPVSPLPGEDS